MKKNDAATPTKQPGLRQRSSGLNACIMHPLCEEARNIFNIFTIVSLFFNLELTNSQIGLCENELGKSMMFKANKSDPIILELSGRKEKASDDAGEWPNIYAS